MQSKCPSMAEWLKKMQYIYTMEYYSAIIKNKIMDGPKDYHTEWSKSDTERQVLYHLYICNLKKKSTSRLIYKTQVESQM